MHLTGKHAGTCASPIKAKVQEFRLEEANKALMELKEGRIRGAKVLKIR
jgi:propanol-preferring alcohol dehydrogenase